jgi:DNA-binding protein YbaB
MDYNKAKELMRLQQEMSKIKKELANTHIEAEVDGLVITIDGEMKVVSVVFEDKSIIGDEKKLEKAIMEATNKGMKKAQEVASTKMQSVAKDMGIDLGGMMGGM